MPPYSALGHTSLHCPRTHLTTLPQDTPPYTVLGHASLQRPRTHLTTLPQDTPPYTVLGHASLQRPRTHLPTLPQDTPPYTVLGHASLQRPRTHFAIHYFFTLPQYTPHCTGLTHLVSAKLTQYDIIREVTFCPVCVCVWYIHSKNSHNLSASNVETGTMHSPAIHTYIYC